MKKNSLIRILVLFACIVGGLLAGGDLYRYLIEVPAWRNLEISNWQIYSRHADLGNGLILFPAEALGNSLILIIASLICLKNRDLNPVELPIHASTIFAVAGLIFTAFAAPVMLHLSKINGDSTRLKNAFNTFHFWGSLRAVAQILSFIFSVVALSDIYKLNVGELLKVKNENYGKEKHK